MNIEKNTIWYKQNNDWLIGKMDDSTIDIENTFPYKDINYNDINDVVLLPLLDEPSILQSIHDRFKVNKIYTDCGEILISINPFRFTDLYSNENKNNFKNKDPMCISQSHIYNTVNKSYNYFKTFNKNQSILISGESGAGKTQSTKIIIDYLTYLVGNNDDNNKNNIQSKIIQSNPILEAFGNAKTIKNDNSSRFGKFIKIKFDNNKIVGGHIETYLLETVRVLSQNANERNYHIFYELLDGIDETERRRLYLNEYFDINNSYLKNKVIIREDYLSNGTIIRDKNQFTYLVEMLSNIGIDKEKQQKIWNIISFILIIGGYNYELDMDKLRSLSRLLDIDLTILMEALYTKRIIINGESIHNDQSQEEFYDSKDALVKKLYSRLFQYIVDEVNYNLKDGNLNKGDEFIGILDIFGFESLEVNSFEQLCINYANETLQNQFNKYSLEQEQREYDKEGIEWKYIEFTNNIDCIHLISGNMGVFEILDEQCKVPNGNDNTFLNRMKTIFNENKYYEYNDKKYLDSFFINHYADKIKYKIEDFCDKNKDIVTNEIQNIVNNYSLFQTKNNISKNKKQKRLSRIGSKTVSYQFKNQMNELMDIIDKTGIHYVRCFKPNDVSSSELFDRPKILNQLQNNGILEAIKVSRCSFPIKYFYDDFKKSYFMLLCGGDENENKNQDIGLENIIDKDLFQYGKTKIFLKSNGFKILEDKKDKAIYNLLIKVQQCFRRWYYHKNYKKLKNNSIIIECYIRKYNAKKLRNKLIEIKNAIKIQSIIRLFLKMKHYTLKKSSINLIKKVIYKWIRNNKSIKIVIIQSYIRKWKLRRRYKIILNGFSIFRNIIRKRLFNTKALKERIFNLEIEINELKGELVQKGSIEYNLNSIIDDLKEKLNKNNKNILNNKTILDNKTEDILKRLKKENKELKTFKNKFIECDLNNLKLKEDNYSYVDCLKKNIDLRIEVQKKLDSCLDENAKLKKLLDDHKIYYDFIII